MKIESTNKVKKGLAEMLKGGVIMDVVNAEQAKIAEKAGASAVMALERIPADIRADGGVARMSSVGVIQEVMDSVSIPVMAKARIGHFVEAQILDSLGIDFIDESEVLTPADEVNHINKQSFKAPFVCGATGLGEATRRIAEGASMIRTKGEAGTGNVVEAVRHMRTITNELNEVIACDENEVVQTSSDLYKSTVSSFICSKEDTLIIFVSSTVWNFLISSNISYHTCLDVGHKIAVPFIGIGSESESIFRLDIF